MKNKRWKQFMAVLLCALLGMPQTGIMAKGNTWDAPEEVIVSENSAGSLSENSEYFTGSGYSENKIQITDTEEPEEPDAETETKIGTETDDETEIDIDTDSGSGVIHADDGSYGHFVGGSVSGNDQPQNPDPAQETHLAPPVISSIKSVNYNTVKVQYTKVEGAEGYEIYRSKKADSGYKKVVTVKNPDALSWKDAKCSTGIKYYYKIRAYRSTGAGMEYSELSVKKVGVAVLPAPKLKSAEMAGGDTAKLAWKKVKGAQGYQIFRCETQTGKYKKIHTVKGNVNKAEIGGQENGKYYYYKIKAYRRVSAKNRLSAFSEEKSVFFNLYGNANETYADKAQRIFGKSYYEKYGSEAEAKAHMTTFAIQVWDLSKDKKSKVSKTVSITTHENIADTVKMIFKEIYESDEKFPIKTIGCYSWRGDASTSEHCCGLAIDINWEENYMIDNGVILSGKYWKPGEDPYSIPLECELVSIMEKYGFSRGMWGNRIDYMHFSYFGT